MENKMFCYQCQETNKNTGCTIAGVCGKKATTANLQDMLIYQTKGLCEITNRLREEGKRIKRTTNQIIMHNLFTTITNANFDEDVILSRIIETINEKESIIDEVLDRTKLTEASIYNEKDEDALREKSTEIGVLATKDEDIRSLRELMTYGIKGMAAYLYHANMLGYDDEEISEFLQYAMAKTLDDSLSVNELVAMNLKTGEFGVRAMQLLDYANTTTFGNPEITSVNIGVRNNPAILISGHDLHDMKELLEQTKGTGVDVYTHSEMLPANYYPELKKYENFVGNYGNAWWKQKEEFESFNGPILMTTNCIVPPKASYIDRLFTTGDAGYPGCKHIDGTIGNKKDFSEIIELAKKCKSPIEIEHGEIIGGFAHNQVIELSDKIVEAVNEGLIKKFVVMAGCDGRHKERNYYTDFAKALPKDSVILTAGCAKYRYNKLNLGDIAGIPRVLDAGQCNDSFSLVVIAMTLQKAFGLEDINDLPIVYNIAWYEQKAVIVLLALLALGVKNIHLGPTLPGFLSENVTKVLVDNFGIAGISTVEEDIENLIINDEKESSDDVMDMAMGELIMKYPQLIDVLTSLGMHCLGCPSSQMETLKEAALVHGLDINEVEVLVRKSL